MRNAPIEKRAKRSMRISTIIIFIFTIYFYAKQSLCRQTLTKVLSFWEEKSYGQVYIKISEDESLVKLSDLLHSNFEYLFIYFISTSTVFKELVLCTMNTHFFCRSIFPYVVVLLSMAGTHTGNQALLQQGKEYPTCHTL